MPPAPFLFEDIQAKREVLTQCKRDLEIGIYGSFHPDFMSHINALRTALINEGYEGTRISEDIPVPPRAGPPVTRNVTALDHSRGLLDVSRVHIFIFCNGGPDHPQLMQSANGELLILYDRIQHEYYHKKQYVSVFMEEGYQETNRALVSGAIEEPEIDKMVSIFTNTDEIIGIGKEFCFDCVLDIYENELRPATSTRIFLEK